MDADGGGEVCLELKIERLWRSGMPPDEIAESTGLSPVWVEEVLSGLPEEEAPADREV